MSEHRVLLVENTAHLSVDLHRVKISREGHEPVFISPGDIAVLVLHHPAITLTHRLLQALAESGSVVISTDEQHMPCAMQWPLLGNVKYVSRLDAQINHRDSGIHKTLWQQLVRCRIESQAMQLAKQQRSGVKRLQRLSANVEPGDPGNCESQAARHFWQHWLDVPHKRTKMGASDGVNAALNFGYAILRSCVCRATVAAGLNPALGIHHHSGENPLNLVDDFLEAYRFLVESTVFENIGEFDEFDREAKRMVATVANLAVTLPDQDYRLPSAIQETVNSYVRILKSGRGALALPAFNPG